MLLPQQRAALFTPYLEEGETVRWTGQPGPWRFLRWHDILALPLSVVWLSLFCGPLLKYVRAHQYGHLEDFAPLLAAGFFLLIWFYGTVGHYLLSYLQRRVIYYAVTDRRVLVLYGILSRNLLGRLHGEITKITPVARDDGDGSLWFDADPPKGWFLQLINGNDVNQHYPGTYGPEAAHFIDIPQARQVYELIMSLRQSPAPAPASVSVPVSLVPRPVREEQHPGSLDPVIAAVLQRYLGVNEQLLWTGQPDPRVLFTTADWFLVPFGLLWSVPLLMVLVQSIREGQGVPYPLFPFLLFGLYLVFGRLLYKYFRKRRTYYGVTNRHILILSNLFQVKLTRQPLVTLPPVEERILSDGSGTLRFGSLPNHEELYEDSGVEYFIYRRNGWTNQEQVTFPPAFRNILHAHQVAMLISELKRGMADAPQRLSR